MRIQIIGKKNSGKTTFCRKLAAYLKDNGHTVWFVKHSSMNHEASDLDTDTGRVRGNGLDLTLFESAAHFELFGPMSGAWRRRIRLEMEWEHDFTLIEGHRDLKGAKLEIVAPGRFEESYYRTEADRGIRGIISEEVLACELPVFSPCDFSGIVRFCREQWRNSADRKGLIRRWIARRKSGFSPGDLRLKSGEVCRKIEAEAEYKRARTVFLFWPMPGEVDLRPLLQNNPEKRFFLPVVLANGRMAFAEYQGQDSLVSSELGIMEPSRTPRLEIRGADLILAPGIAFTRDGDRLGRGGGFYDRLMEERNPGQAVWGTAFDFQLLDELPMAGHDFAVDRVITG